MQRRARTRVLLVHDHHDARADLVARLSARPDVVLTCDTTTVASARTALAADEHDVVVTGAHLPDAGAAEVVRSVRDTGRGTSVVLLLDAADPSDVAEAIRSGADGIADTATADADLVLAVRHLAPGSCLLHRSAATSLAAMCPPESRSLLSRRELDVMECLADGLTNAQIAARLYVSRETVKTHVAHLLRKLEVGSRRAAVDRARLIGVLDSPPGTADPRADHPMSRAGGGSPSPARTSVLTAPTHPEGSTCAS